ncbi:DUF4173 domain-containing protein [soil metagenome]
MSDRSDLAIRTLMLAAVLGLIGELLLRVDPWGINAPLAALALGTVSVTLERRAGRATGATWWLLGAAPLFAAIFAWRASGPLLFLSVLAVIVSLGAASLAAHRRPLHTAGAWDVLAEGIAMGLHTAFGAVRLPLGIRRDSITWAPWHTRTGAVIRGAMLAIPPLIVFGVLFMSADEAFARMAMDLFRFDVELVASHVALFGVFSWLGAGYLYWVLLDDGARVPSSERIGARLGALEVAVVLGLVTLLFVTFIVIQSTHLFGGEALVQRTTGLTYAEYARDGFFELVVASFLLLPLLLASVWLVRDEQAAGRRPVQLLAGVLVVLIYLIMGSALYRMRIYQEAYGLTQLRFHTTSFMAWLALVFMFFVATVLRGRPQRFIGATIAAAFVAVLVLAVVHPEARIAAANVARATAGAELDHAHLQSALGADAVPVMLASLASLPPADQCQVAQWLTARWGTEARRNSEGDWRTFNWSRSRARTLVRENEQRLLALPCAPG